MTEATPSLGGCKECGQPLVRKGRGPAPTHCSAVCRARAKGRRDKTNGKYEEYKAALRAKNAAAREANARPCPYCGAPMTHPRRVQCGKPECKRAATNQRMCEWQRAHKAETGEWYGRRFTYERACERCGKTWTTVNSTARYCSRACTNQARSYVLTCQGCGQSWNAGRGGALYCSPACKEGAKERAEAERRRTAWLPAISDWPYGQAWCALLGRHPARRYRPGSRLFVQGNCIRCGTAFCVQSESGLASYCSRQCQKADGKARRRAVQRNAYIEHVNRSRIFERDNWTCRLCGKPVKRDVVVPHPLAPVIDHIIPLAAGGKHQPANAQCAHFLCNSIKGDRGGGEQLMLIG